MTDIVQILHEMQKDKECPMLVHMALSEAISEIKRLRKDRDYWERNANVSVAVLKNELSAEKKDAERYRWLYKNCAFGLSGAPGWTGVIRFKLVEQDSRNMTEAIDAAMEVEND